MDGSILFLALLLNPRAARRRSQEAGDDGLVGNHASNKEDESKPPTASPSKMLAPYSLSPAKTLEKKQEVPALDRQ